MVAGTVVVVDAVVVVGVVVVVRVPAQLVVVPSHWSSAVSASPSSQARPWQYALTVHELRPETPA